MQKVKWYRKGEWLENNALVVSGYDLNEHGGFVEREGATTMITNVDFNNFSCFDLTAKQVGQKHVEFNIGKATYLADISLYNALFDLAEDILQDVVNVVLANNADGEIVEQSKPALRLV